MAKSQKTPEFPLIFLYSTQFTSSDKIRKNALSQWYHYQLLKLGPFD